MMISMRTAVLVGALAALVYGCGEEAEKAEVIRPVRVMKVQDVVKKVESRVGKSAVDKRIQSKVTQIAVGQPFDLLFLQALPDLIPFCAFVIAALSNIADHKYMIPRRTQRRFG